MNVGVFDYDLFDKIVWFVRFCDVFNIFIIIFIDVSGFLSGVN